MYPLKQPAMNDITASFGTLYHPVKAFVIYQKDGMEKNMYVESYDMGKDGTPINAHPLTVREGMALAKALDTSEELTRNFLKPKGILPKNVLYINPDQNGYAVWYTPAQQINLLFSKDLTIPNGKAFIPSLVWKASRETLQIYMPLKTMRNLTKVRFYTMLLSLISIKMARSVWER